MNARKLFAFLLVALGCGGSTAFLTPAYADCAPLAADKGQVVGTVTLPADGTYALWLRLNAPDASRDSVFVQVDDQCPVIAGDAANGGYEWVNYQDGDKTKMLSFDLKAGQHTIKLAGREAGTGADKAVFLADNCVPTGMGTNCPITEDSDQSGPTSLLGVFSPHATKAALAARRHWLAISGCAAVTAAALGLLIWKYIAFVKIRRLPSGHTDDAHIVVGDGGLSPRNSRWDHLKAFAYHHRLWLVVCGGVTAAAVTVGVVVAATPGPVLEVESGTLSGGATVVADSAASSGKFVLFNTNAAAANGGHTTGGSGSGSGSGSTSGGSNGGGSGGSGGNPTSLNLPRIAWEGGPSYYANFSKATAWNNPNFFPIGVWYESVLSSGDTSKDQAAGLNTYVELTDNSSMSLIRSAGMYAVPSGTLAGYGSEDTGWLITDEADMNYGPGNDPWSGTEGWNTCIPIQDNGGKCGYTVMSTLKSHLPQGDGRLFYSNYGKGVMMWDSDPQAAQFVNGYTNFTSADMYFYTDPNLCGGESQTWLGIPTNQCRMSANYGFVIDRMRTLDAMDGKRQPIFAFVEDGCPFSNGGCINANQIGGAVMSSLIHEARGIIYFNHNFGSSCISQHVLRDSCGAAVRPTVTAINSMLKDLAPVLNTQSYQYSFNGNLDTMLKGLNGTYYIFAMQKRGNASGNYTFTLPAGLNASSVQLPYESNRTIPVSGGKFSDSFAAEYSYHVYKVIP